MYEKFGKWCGRSRERARASATVDSFSLKNGRGTEFSHGGTGFSHGGTEKRPRWYRNFVRFEKNTKKAVPPAKKAVPPGKNDQKFRTTGALFFLVVFFCTTAAVFCTTMRKNRTTVAFFFCFYKNPVPPRRFLYHRRKLIVKISHFLKIEKIEFFEKVVRCRAKPNMGQCSHTRVLIFHHIGLWTPGLTFSKIRFLRHSGTVVRLFVHPASSPAGSSTRPATGHPPSSN